MLSKLVGMNLHACAPLAVPAEKRILNLILLFVTYLNPNSYTDNIY